MFKKVLIANRGEIAVRIIRTCRDMGLHTVALYDDADRGSLHVRLADECARLASHRDFMDSAAILSIARKRAVDAIHPGYGFLAEDSEFISDCEQAGIAFIGPPSAIVSTLRHKIGTLQTAGAAGIPTVAHSSDSFGLDEMPAIHSAASDLGYPVVVKSCRGGRGRAERLVLSPAHLPEAVRRSQAESATVYGDQRVFLERAILPAHQVAVQIAGDNQGNIIHFGDREGSVIRGNQKLIEEAPAVCLSSEQRVELLAAAVQLARLVSYQGVGTVEFLVDEQGRFYFSEIKSRIQIVHPLPEMMSRVDLIELQLRIAAGELLPFEQEDIDLDGCAIMCRVFAEDPVRRHLASPGHLKRVRLPGGPEVRVDTYVYCDSDVPAAYDPLLAKVTVWASDRRTCVQRTRRALEDLTLLGTPTNLPLLLSLVREPGFVAGDYTTDLLARPRPPAPAPETDMIRRDLAVAAAVVYTRRREAFDPLVPDRLLTGWHQTSRRLPE